MGLLKPSQGPYSHAVWNRTVDFFEIDQDSESWASLKWQRVTVIVTDGNGVRDLEVTLVMVPGKGPFWTWMDGLRAFN